MNKVILMGRMTRDPEYRQTANGASVTRFTVAVPSNSKDKDAEFISCIAFSTNADNISKYFKKGKPIALIGNLQNHNWEDKDGVKHYDIETVVDRWSFVPRDTSEDAEEKAPTRQNEAPRRQTATQPTIDDFMPIEGMDDLPF